MRVIRLMLLLIVPVLLYPDISTSQTTTPQLTRGPYLQQVTQNSIIIRWRTDLATTSHVTFGTDLNYSRVAGSGNLTTEHLVKLSGLHPGTRYFYTVGNNTQLLQGDSTNNFYTAPKNGTTPPVRIWATGDFGVGSTAQAAVRDAYMNYSVKPTNLWIWLGDNAYYTGTDGQYQNFVFNMYPQQLKQFPLYPAPGNHDYGQVGYQSDTALTTAFPYFSIFTVPQQGEAGGHPSGTPKYYSYNYSNIHFISLDSYGALNEPGSDMYNWLAEDLAANSQRWTIVYFHHPPYSKGTHDSDREVELIDMRTHIVPLLETFKVDLVLSGHSHSNERSYLINGHYGASDSFDSSMKVADNTHHYIKKVPYKGTIYAVCGTSGQYPGGPQGGGAMPCMYFNDFSTNCSMVIDVDGALLTAKYLSANGTILDEFTVSKPGQMAPLHAGAASCEISYHPGNNVIFFSMFLTEHGSFSAAMYNMLGEKIKEFDQLPASLDTGYHVQAVSLEKSVKTNGIYLIKVRAGNQLFSKKIFIKKN